MRSVLKQTLCSVILLICLHPILSTACAILPKDKSLERKQKYVEEAKVETLKLKEEADLIFIGFLKKLDIEQETLALPTGEQILQRHRALFKVDEEIKGHYPTGHTLEFTVNKNQVWMSLGCRPQYWQLPKENGAGEMYLVYSRDGKILRTNHIPLDGQAMNGYEEAALVRER